MSRVLVDGEGSRHGGDAPLEELSKTMGSGVFTTARVAAGVMVRRDLHRQRLLTEWTDGGQVSKALREADQLSRELKDGMVRVCVGVRDDGRPIRVVATAAARRRPFRPGDAPLQLGLAMDPRDIPAKKRVHRPGLKRLDTLARRVGMDGAILIGPEGVREGTWFHIAVKDGDRWATPPLSPLVSFGTTRAAFLVDAQVDERPISLDELFRAKEVVALSSLLEIGEAHVRRDLLIQDGAKLSLS